MDSYLGHTIAGAYQVEALLRTDPSTQTYRVFHKAQSKLEVLRLLPGFPSPTSQAFLAQAQQCQGLRHPNISPVSRWGEEETLSWYTSEQLDGESVRNFLKARSRPLLFGNVGPLLDGILRALVFGAEQGISHGHLSSSTIWLNKKLRPLLLDFGIPYPLEIGTALRPIEPHEQTYVPPELRENPTGVPSFQADGYACGVLLYEALTGSPPPEGPDQDDQRAQAFQSLSPPPPVPVFDFVRQALAFDPAARFLSPQDMLNQLEAIGGGALSGSQITGTRGQVPLPVPVPSAPKTLDFSPEIEALPTPSEGELDPSVETSVIVARERLDHALEAADQIAAAKQFQKILMRLGLGVAACLLFSLLGMGWIAMQSSRTPPKAPVLIANSETSNEDFADSKAAETSFPEDAPPPPPPPRRIHRGCG